VVSDGGSPSGLSSRPRELRTRMPKGVARVLHNRKDARVIKPNSTPSERLYFPQIDGLRFIAFFLVLLHHYTPMDAWTKAPGGFVAFITRIQAFGWMGVDIFLTLSSFLIFTLLLEERSRTGTVSLKRFYIRRALRIWPLYFPYLLFAMLVVPFLTGTREAMGATIHQHLLTFLTFTGNFSYAYFANSLTQFFAHLWTISLEEQFYFLVPLMVFFAGGTRRPALYLAAAGMALAMVFRWYVLSNAIPYPMVWVNPLCRIDPFIMGALATYILRRKKHWLDQKVGWLWALASIAGYALVIDYPGIGASQHTIWQLSLVSISAFCLILAALSRRGLRNVLAWGPLPYLGKISFGLYVYHEGVLYSWNILHLPNILRQPTPTNWALQLALILGVVIAVSVISYQYYERAFLKRKERFETIHSRRA
jgi:peptidoglycan/LPS O-acetylase OafA/YrhL